MVGQALSDKLFQQFSELVYKECGINLHDGKRELLQARLNKRLRATGIGCYREYYDFIQNPNNGSEVVHFLDSISTNLTYFFREPKHFQYLEQISLPALIREKNQQSSKRIRIWSAGCSTGEEPYSLAMVVSSHLSDLQRWDFRILATDISTRVLAVAVSGVYSEEKMTHVPKNMQQSYFTRRKGPGGEIFYEVGPQLKKIITFRRLNLQENYPFNGPFDYIFCRNVMIYFDKETQQQLIQKMSRYLGPGGCLMVGHSESLTGLSHGLSYVQPSVYRKETP
jgi:chemotaxis protein methyltransferase CheR